MPDTEGTRELVLPRIARGEERAVEECLERFGPLVWSLARRMWRDAATVEDLVQEIFIEVWKSAERYDASKASEATFIATIARRRAIDRRRKASRAPEEHDIEDVTIGAADPGLAQVELGDDVERAHAALGELKPDQRRVILLNVIEGLTHQEIAATTGMPLGTVKSHIRRGIGRVAKVLGAEDEEARP